MADTQAKEYRRWFASQGGMAIKKSRPKDYFSNLAKLRWEKERKKKEEESPSIDN